MTTTTQLLADPGVYDGTDLPWIHPDDYHANDRISRSQLVSILKSPAAFQAQMPLAATRALLRGDAIHTAILEPERFAAEYVYPPVGLNRTRKADKLAWDEFLEEHEGKKIVGWDAEAGRLYSEDAEIVEEVSRAVRENEVVRRILQGEGRTEPTYAWDDDGVRLRCRPDRVVRSKEGKLIVVDLKSCDDCAPSAFAAKVARYSYHFQAAMYLDGVAKAGGEEPHDFLFVAFETTYPFHCRSFVLDSTALARGRELYHRALDLYRECSASGVWPDYSTRVDTLRIPQWAMHDD